MVHRTFKSAVSRTNGKMIERDLIKRYNTLQALRNIIDGTLDSRYNNSLGNGYYQDNVFRSLLSSWYATSATIYDTKEIGIIIIYYYYFVKIFNFLFFFFLLTIINYIAL